MSDKGTGGSLDPAAEFEGLGERLKGKVLSRVEGMIEFTEAQLLDLTELTDDVALALAGDERALAHVKAQLALKKFQTEARAYLEAAEFRRELGEAILEVAGSLLSAGAKLAAEALAGALSGAIG